MDDRMEGREIEVVGKLREDKEGGGLHLFYLHLHLHHLSIFSTPSIDFYA